MHPTLCPHTALLHTPLSDFRWDRTLTFIHNVFVFLGAAVKRGKKDTNLTRQLCLRKETIYQKLGVIYASLSELNPNSACVISSATVLRDPSRPQRQIRSARRPLQLVHQQLGRPLDTPGRLLHLLCLEKAEQHGQIQDTNEWCLSV